MGGIRKFEINKTGRDFVTGDVHGAYELLEDALSLVEFDTENDRLFPVGDLINRGPNSDRVLDFLDRPYVNPIIGNHEVMMLQTFCGNEDIPSALERIGMDWVVAQISPDDRIRLMHALSELPDAIQISTNRGRVGLVHGEVPKGVSWQDFLNFIDTPNGGIAPARHSKQSAHWGRDRFKTGDTSGVEGIDRVFSGHTTSVSGPRRLGNCFFIDTGAYKSAVGEPGMLTLTDVNALSEAIAPSNGVMPIIERAQGRINIITECPNNPFEPFEDYRPANPDFEFVGG